jgi:hypothetical protein
MRGLGIAKQGKDFLPKAKTLKIQLNFGSKICHFLKKLLCKVSNFFIHRLGRRVYQKDKKKVEVVI